jgi:molybdopterin converting factor small subunit
MKIAGARVILKIPESQFGTNNAKTRRRSIAMTIRVLAFAQLREIFNGSVRSLDLPDGALVEDAWAALMQTHPALARERDSTRAALNGRLVPFAERLHDGDELALLPPVGGG